MQVTRTITGQNQFSDPISVNGWFNVSVSGTFSATVTLQRSTDNSTWLDVGTFSSAYEGSSVEPEIMWYRIGVKTGEYTSGSVVVRVGHDREFAS